MKWQKMTVCVMIKGVGILDGSYQDSFIEDFRMSCDTPKFVPETGGEEEETCTFVTCYFVEHAETNENFIKL
jgi:hypothetical protein